MKRHSSLNESVLRTYTNNIPFRSQPQKQNYLPNILHQHVLEELGRKSRTKSFIFHNDILNLIIYHPFISNNFLECIKSL